MELFDAIHVRHSVREFDPAVEVPHDVIERILTAAIEAPSAGNCQPWRFLVVRDLALRVGLVQAAYGQAFVAQAPLAIVVCADLPRAMERYGTRGTTLYCLQDTAAAVTHMLLAATALGFGACWVGAFDEAEASRILGLPNTLRPVAIVPLGRPARPTARETTRRSLHEIVSFL